MDNIILIEFETRARVKGIYGMFSGRMQFGNHIPDYNVNIITKIIRDYLKDWSTISIVVEDLDNHRNNWTAARFINSYGSLEYVTFSKPNEGRETNVSELNTRQLKKLVLKAIEDVEAYIKEKEISL